MRPARKLILAICTVPLLLGGIALSDPLLAVPRPTCESEGNCGSCLHTCTLVVTRKGNTRCYFDGWCYNGFCSYSCAPREWPPGTEHRPQRAGERLLIRSAYDVR
jgi:hypothetical protein